MTHYGASNVPESLDSYHKQICFRLLVLNRIPPHRAASDGLGAPAWWPTVVLPHRAASDGLGAPGGPLWYCLTVQLVTGWGPLVADNYKIAFEALTQNQNNCFRLQRLSPG